MPTIVLVIGLQLPKSVFGTALKRRVYNNYGNGRQGEGEGVGVMSRVQGFSLWLRWCYNIALQFSIRPGLECQPILIHHHLDVHIGVLQAVHELQDLITT